ncbi:hypothetical protein [Pseudonocardia asaccharolytica]|uniref:Uncharacterized protein n=1 Tax=Pseudonocardia asaccharolytica DSM 44247 = NBRC 16224 TaxID=1123024 RepID=A0A511D7I4_9PSEU|nr:hypothetical protein [Pseudonocardia asaccharolytica]GEL20722.1 hypothetical protein PA7_45590 [Pseudonocardia asaccharolytica DSM 44247 = NBRC 16224]
MGDERLFWRSDVDVGGWIAPRLGPFDGRVCTVVPRGFEAYVRILHPVSNDQDPDGPDYYTWAQVCAFTGRRPHALMQWRAISGGWADGREPIPIDHPWPGENPEIGFLTAESLAALCAVLARFTRPDAECFFALWEGYGWIHGSPAVVALGPGGWSATVPPAFPREIMDGPRLRHPHRDYILFSGPLSAAGSLHVPGPWEQTPNIIWPEDQSWCVASEIDFDSTVAAGSRELVDALLAAPGLEVWEVGPDDSLAFDGDRVNT